MCITEPVNTESGNRLSNKEALLIKNVSLLASLEVAHAAKKIQYISYFSPLTKNVPQYLFRLTRKGKYYPSYYYGIGKWEQL